MVSSSCFRTTLEKFGIWRLDLLLRVEPLRASVEVMALRHALDLLLRVLQPPETRGLRHFEHALSLFCSPLLARHAVALARALRRALQPAFDRALGRARGSAALALVALRRPKPRWLKATAALACAGAAGRYYQHKRSVSALVTRVRKCAEACQDDLGEIDRLTLGGSGAAMGPPTTSRSVTSRWRSHGETATPSRSHACKKVCLSSSS